MLVVFRVPLTLVATHAAGRRAGLDSRAEQVDIRSGLAGDDAPGGVADVGAIEVEANAADQLPHVRLAETGVGAAGACSRTVEALVDAAQQRVSIEACRLWMGLEYLSNCHFLSLPCVAGAGPPDDVMSRAPRSRLAKLMAQRMKTIRRFW